MPEELNNQGIPLYYQLKEIIKEKIGSGHWSIGSQIPNEMDLVDEYHVSRATVRQAVLQLVREGFLTRKKGVGTFVAQPKFIGDSISLAFPAEGGYHETISKKIILCPPWLAEQLKLTITDEVYEIVRIRYYLEEPGALEISYVPVGLFPGLLDIELKARLYEVLAKRYGTIFTRFETYIEPIMLDNYEAQNLKVEPKQLALKVTKLWTDIQERRVILHKIIIRGDRSKVLFRQSDIFASSVLIVK